MAALMTRSEIEALLRPGLNKVTTDFNKTRSEPWKDLFYKSESKMAFEKMAKGRKFAFGAHKPEGAAFQTLGTPGIAYETVWTHKSFGGQCFITREAVRDNLYKQFQTSAKDLLKVMSDTKNLLCSLYILNGFPVGTIGTAESILADGQTLFSEHHPIAQGTKEFSNFVNAGLNETSLENAKLLFQKMLDEAGIYSPLRPQKLIITPDLEWTAKRLMLSDRRAGTANNDKNVISSFLSNISENVWLNSTGAKPWCITSDVNEEGSSLVLFQREEPTTSTHVEQSTFNVVLTVYESWSAGCHDPRGIVGGYNAA